MENSQKKEKRNLFLVVPLFMLVLVLAFSFAALTYSKYISKNPATVSASVAKWDFSSDFKYGGSSTTNLNLGSTVNSDTLVSGKIAPGTSGEFDVVIDAGDSETDINYTVAVTDETAKPTNLYFKVQGVDTKYSTLAEALTAANLNSGRINYDDATKSITKTIEWHWDYETTDGDTTDTQDGINAAAYTFSITITGTQVNPSLGR